MWLLLLAIQLVSESRRRQSWGLGKEGSWHIFVVGGRRPRLSLCWYLRPCSMGCGVRMGRGRSGTRQANLVGPFDVFDRSSRLRAVNTSPIMSSRRTLAFGRELTQGSSSVSLNKFLNHSLVSCWLSFSLTYSEHKFPRTSWMRILSVCNRDENKSDHSTCWLTQRKSFQHGAWLNNKWTTSEQSLSNRVSFETPMTFSHTSSQIFPLPPLSSQQPSSHLSCRGLTSFPLPLLC